jgi:hypothetical protein
MHDTSEDSATATSIQFSIGSSNAAAGCGSRRSSSSNHVKSSITATATGAVAASLPLHPPSTASPPVTCVNTKTKLAPSSAAPLLRGSWQHPPLSSQPPALRATLATPPASASSSLSFIESPAVLRPSRSVSPSDASLLFVQAVAKLDTPHQAGLHILKQPSDQESSERSSDNSVADAGGSGGGDGHYHRRLTPVGPPDKKSAASATGDAKGGPIAARVATHSITSSLDSIDFQEDGVDSNAPQHAPTSVAASTLPASLATAKEVTSASSNVSPEKSSTQAKKATPPATLRVSGKTLVLMGPVVHGAAGANTIVAPEKAMPAKTVAVTAVAGSPSTPTASPPSPSPPPPAASVGRGVRKGVAAVGDVAPSAVPLIATASLPSVAVTVTATASTQRRGGSQSLPRYDASSAQMPLMPDTLSNNDAAPTTTAATTKMEKLHYVDEGEALQHSAMHQRTQSLSSLASPQIAHAAGGFSVNRISSFTHVTPHGLAQGGAAYHGCVSSTSVQPEDDLVFCTVSDMTNAASLRGGTDSVLPNGAVTAAGLGNFVASRRASTVLAAVTAAARRVQSFDASLDESNTVLTPNTPLDGATAAGHGFGKLKSSSTGSQPNTAAELAGTVAHPTARLLSPTHLDAHHVMRLPTFNRPPSVQRAGEGQATAAGRKDSTRSEKASVGVTGHSATATSTAAHAAATTGTVRTRSNENITPLLPGTYGNRSSGQAAQGAAGLRDHEKEEEGGEEEVVPQQPPRRRSSVSALLNALGGGKALLCGPKSGSTASKSGTEDNDDGSNASLRSHQSTSHSIASGLSRLSSRLKRGAQRAISARRPSEEEGVKPGKEGSPPPPQRVSVTHPAERRADVTMEAQRAVGTSTNTTVTMAPADLPTPFDSTVGRGRDVAALLLNAFLPGQQRTARSTPTRGNQSSSVDGSIDFHTDDEEGARLLQGVQEGHGGRTHPAGNAPDPAMRLEGQLSLSQQENHNEDAGGEVGGGGAAMAVVVVAPSDEQADKRHGEREARRHRSEQHRSRRRRHRHRHRRHRKHGSRPHRSRSSSANDSGAHSASSDASASHTSSSESTTSRPTSASHMSSERRRRQRESRRRHRRAARAHDAKAEAKGLQQTPADESDAGAVLPGKHDGDRKASTRWVAASNPSSAASDGEVVMKRQKKRSKLRSRQGERATGNAKKDTESGAPVRQRLHHHRLGEQAAVRLYEAAEDYVRRRLRRSCEVHGESPPDEERRHQQQQREGRAAAHRAGTAAKTRNAVMEGEPPTLLQAAVLAARRRAILAESRVHSTVDHFGAAWHNRSVNRQRLWQQQVDDYRDRQRKLQQLEVARQQRSQEAAIAAAVATAASRSTSRARAEHDAKSPKGEKVKRKAAVAPLRVSPTPRGNRNSNPGAAAHRLAVYEASLTSDIIALDNEIEKRRRHGLWTEVCPTAAAAADGKGRHDSSKLVDAATAQRLPRAGVSAPNGSRTTRMNPLTAGPLPSSSLTLNRYIDSLRRSPRTMRTATAKSGRAASSLTSKERGGGVRGGSSPAPRKTAACLRTASSYESPSVHNATLCEQPESTGKVAAGPRATTAAAATITTAELQRRYERLLDEMMAHATCEGGDADSRGHGEGARRAVTVPLPQRPGSNSRKVQRRVSSSLLLPASFTQRDVEEAEARRCAAALRAEYYHLPRPSLLHSAHLETTQPPHQPAGSPERRGSEKTTDKDDVAETVLAQVVQSYAQGLRPSCSVCRPQHFNEYVTLGLLSMLHSPCDDTVDDSVAVTSARGAAHTGAVKQRENVATDHSASTLLQRRIREELYAPPKHSQRKSRSAVGTAVSANHHPITTTSTFSPLLSSASSLWFASAAGAVVEASKAVPQPEPHPFTPSLPRIFGSLRARLSKEEHLARRNVTAEEQAAAQALQRQYIIETICVLQALRAKEEEKLRLQALSSHSVSGSRRHSEEEEYVVHEPVTPAVVHAPPLSRLRFTGGDNSAEDGKANADDESDGGRHGHHLPTSILWRVSGGSAGGTHSSWSSSSNTDPHDGGERHECRYADQLGDQESSTSDSSNNLHARSWRGATPPPPLSAERQTTVEDDGPRPPSSSSVNVVRRTLQRDLVPLREASISASCFSDQSHSPLSSTGTSGGFVMRVRNCSSSSRGGCMASRKDSAVATLPGSPPGVFSVMPLPWEPLEEEAITTNAADSRDCHSRHHHHCNDSGRRRRSSSGPARNVAGGSGGGGALPIPQGASVDELTPVFAVHDEDSHRGGDGRSSGSLRAPSTKLNKETTASKCDAALTANSAEAVDGSTRSPAPDIRMPTSCPQLNVGVAENGEPPSHEDKSSSPDSHSGGVHDESSKEAGKLTEEKKPTNAMTVLPGVEQGRGKPSGLPPSSPLTSSASLQTAAQEAEFAPAPANSTRSRSNASTATDSSVSADKVALSPVGGGPFFAYSEASGLPASSHLVRPLSIDRGDHSGSAGGGTTSSSSSSSAASHNAAADAQPGEPARVPSHDEEREKVERDEAQPQSALHDDPPPLPEPPGTTTAAAVSPSPLSSVVVCAEGQASADGAEAAVDAGVKQLRSDDGDAQEEEEEDEAFEIHTGASNAEEGIVVHQDSTMMVTSSAAAATAPVAVVVETLPSDAEAEAEAQVTEEVGNEEAAAAAGAAVGDASPGENAGSAETPVDPNAAEDFPESVSLALAVIAGGASEAPPTSADERAATTGATPQQLEDEAVQATAAPLGETPMQDVASQTSPLILQPKASPRRRVRFSLPLEHLHKYPDFSEDDGEDGSEGPLNNFHRGKDDHEVHEVAEPCSGAEELEKVEGAITPEKTVHRATHDSPHTRRSPASVADTAAAAATTPAEAQVKEDEEAEDSVSEKTAVDLLEKLNGLDALLLYKFPSYFTTGTDSDGLPGAVMRPLQDIYTPRRAFVLTSATATEAAPPTPLSQQVTAKSAVVVSPLAAHAGAGQAAEPAGAGTDDGNGAVSPAAFDRPPSPETAVSAEASEGLSSFPAPADSADIPTSVNAHAHLSLAATAPPPLPTSVTYPHTHLAPPQLPAESLGSQLRRKYGLRPPPALRSRPVYSPAASAVAAASSSSPSSSSAHRLPSRPTRAVPTLPSPLSTYTSSVPPASPLPPSFTAMEGTGSLGVSVKQRAQPVQPAAPPKAMTPAVEEYHIDPAGAAPAVGNIKRMTESPQLFVQSSGLTPAQKTAFLLSDAPSTTVAGGAATPVSNQQQQQQQPDQQSTANTLSVPPTTAATATDAIRHTVPSSQIVIGKSSPSSSSFAELDSTPLSLPATASVATAVARRGPDTSPLAKAQLASHWF